MCRWFCYNIVITWSLPRMTTISSFSFIFSLAEHEFCTWSFSYFCSFLSHIRRQNESVKFTVKMKLSYFYRSNKLWMQFFTPTSAREIKRKSFRRAFFAMTTAFFSFLNSFFSIVQSFFFFKMKILFWSLKMHRNDENKCILLGHFVCRRHNRNDINKIALQNGWISKWNMFNVKLKNTLSTEQILLFSFPDQFSMTCLCVVVLKASMIVLRSVFVVYLLQINFHPCTNVKRELAFAHRWKYCRNSLANGINTKFTSIATGEQRTFSVWRWTQMRIDCNLSTCQRWREIFQKLVVLLDFNAD